LSAFNGKLLFTVLGNLKVIKPFTKSAKDDSKYPL